MGPVLLFRGATTDQWRLTAVFGTQAGETPPPLHAEGGAPVEAELLAEHNDRRLWRYDFALPVGRSGAVQEYGIGDARWRVHLPAEGEGLRVAYTACNGIPFTDAGDDDPVRNERWRDLAARHAETPFHLLLQGGDQLYADTIWEEVPELQEWQGLLQAERREAPCPAEMERHIAGYYRARYTELWSQFEVVPLLASIPSLMMWDDHDIFDGWGSYEPADQACPVYQGIWRAARESFALFQLGARPDELPPGFGDRQGGHFGFAYKVGDVGIIAPDLRSDRSQTQVMGAANHAWFDETLAGFRDCRQVLVMSSVPLLHADLSLFERISVLERVLARFRALPEERDDLIDQWRSIGHRAECARVLRRLVDFAAASGARVAVLSGEIHLGARGVIRDGAVAIDQLTSSAVVSPPPPGLITKLFDLLSKGRQRVGAGLKARILPIPGLGRRYLHARNWLELALAKAGSIEAAWHAEGAEQPYRLDIPAAPTPALPEPAGARG